LLNIKEEKMNRIPLYGWLAWLSLFIFFLFSLVIGKTSNFSFYLLILVAFLHVAHIIKKKDFALFHAYKQYGWVYLAAIGMPLAILIHDVVEHSFQIRSYDIPSRLALIGLLTLGAISLSSRKIKSIRWAFMIGVLLATIKLAIVTDDGAVRMAVVDFISIIALSQLTLLLAIFAVFSIIWSERKNFLMTFVLGMTGLVGLYNIYISQTRGAWIAIPIFVLLLCIVFFKNERKFKCISWAFVLIVALAGSFSTTTIVRHRVGQAISDLHQYADKENIDTSIGTRLQLWKASWILFSENPIIGVGVDKFKASLKDLAAREIITNDAATFPHSHNELLFNMATLGIFGLIGVVVTYFVPLYYFAKEMRHADREVVAAAAMGISLCLGYFIFGLVDVMFMWRICDIFYSMSIAIFLAFIIRKKYELQTIGTKQAGL